MALLSLIKIGNFFDYVTCQEGQSRKLHSISFQVLRATYVALMLLLAFWCIKAFIKAAASNEEFPVLVAGRKTNLLEKFIITGGANLLQHNDRHHNNINPLKPSGNFTYHQV
jgi:hypothetical protein